METIIIFSSVLAIIAIIAYIKGRFDEMEEPTIDFYQRANDYNLNCKLETTKICLYPRELAVREEQAYSRGRYEEQMKRYDTRLTPDKTEEMTMENVCRELGKDIKIKK